MRYLIDTGILLRLINRNDAEHDVIRHAIHKLKQEGDILATTCQNFVEFWNVCTRPVSARGGYGLSIQATERRLRLLESSFELIPELPETFTEWKRLVIDCEVKGVQVHDAKIVAIMKLHNIDRILTLNPSDFHRYKGITVLTPSNVINRIS